MQPIQVQAGLGISVWLLLGVFLLVSLWLLWFGLRGRKIDDHPLCRRCRYDLTGNVQASSCPECGADLTHENATRIGNRKRRLRCISFASLSLLLNFGLIGVAGWTIIGNVNLQQYKPVWMLRYETTSTNTSTERAALDELHRRLLINQLSLSQVNTVVVDALTIQADLSHPWLERWGNLIEEARKQGNVTDTQWRQYAKQATEGTIVLRIRPRIAQGNPIVIRVTETKLRIGTGRVFFHESDCNLLQIEHLRLENIRRSEGIMSSFGGSTSITTHRNSSKELSIGQHTGLLTGKYILYEMLPGYQRGAKIYEWDIKSDTRFEIVSENETTATPINDTSLQNAVEKAISVPSFAQVKKNADEYQIKLRLWNPPVPLAYNVLIDDGDHERQITQVSIVANGVISFKPKATFVGLDADTVDVILRPSAEVAERTINLTEYYNGEIVIKDVPVTRP